MPPPRDKDARRYYRVAYQRYEDGIHLLEAGRHQAAIYLTGYAIECILKALLIEVSPVGGRAEVLREFRGTLGHNNEWLASRLAQSIGQLPRDVALDVAFVSSWSTDLRYEPGPGNREDAERFQEVARSILAWVDGRI